MKQKLLFVRGNTSIPFEIFKDMLNSLKNVEYSEQVIGPSTVKEMIHTNTDATGYEHTIFNELLTNKILLDYNSIIVGLELLKFYKKNGLIAFDDSIELLSEIKLGSSDE